MLSRGVSPTCIVLAAVIFWTTTFCTADLDSSTLARAQFPTAVTTFHAPAPAVVVGQPVVTFTPRRAGLLGLRTVYRPEMGVLLSSAPAPVVSTTTFFAPAAPVPTTTFFAPSIPTTSFMVPAAPVTSFMVPSAPVTTFMAPSAPVTTFMVPMAPATSFSAPIFSSPAPVTTFFAPSLPTQRIPTQGFSSFVPGY